MQTQIGFWIGEVCLLMLLPIVFRSRTAPATDVLNSQEGCKKVSAEVLHHEPPTCIVYHHVFMMPGLCSNIPI